MEQVGTAFTVLFGNEQRGFLTVIGCSWTRFLGGFSFELCGRQSRESASGSSYC